MLKKRLILAAILLLLVAALATTALAAEPEGEWLTASSDEIFQEGGFPRARESVPATFSASTADLDGAKAAMLAGMESLSAEINLSSYNIPNSEIKTLYTDVVNENPQLFYMDNCYEYNTYGQTVYKFMPKYKYDNAETIKTMQAALEAKVKEILEPVGEGWTELEKIVYLHDYLAANYEYDLTYTVRDAYGLLVDGTGVCQAYMLAYRLLLSRVDVESGTVTSESINHTWNLVKIDETWYHVDVTWDDPTDDMLGLVQHTNFLLSETGMIAKKSSKSKYKYDWVYSEDVPTEDTTYESYYWKDVASPIVPLGETWYYLLRDKTTRMNTIMATDDVAEAGTKKTDYSDKWYAWGSSSSYWTGCYSGLDVYDGKLVFNGPSKVYSYDPKTGTTTTLYTLTTDEAATGYIYGSRVDGSTLKYQLSQQPYDGGTVKEHGLRVYTEVKVGGYSYCLESGKKTLTVRKTTSEGSVMVAWYDGNGRMLSISLITTSGESDELKAPTGAASLRLMAANGNWKPLAAAVSLALSSGT